MVVLGGGGVLVSEVTLYLPVGSKFITFLEAMRVIQKKKGGDGRGEGVRKVSALLERLEVLDTSSSSSSLLPLQVIEGPRASS